MSSTLVTGLLALGSLFASSFINYSPYMVKTIAPGDQWANTPLQLVHTPAYETNQTDLFTNGATHMALVHNAMIRGFNSIHHQAPLVEEKHKADFVSYSKVWAKFVMSHHHDEEDNLFVAVSDILDDKTIWADTRKEHASFVDGVRVFQAYLNNLKDAKDLSGSQVVALLDKFSKDFENHMHSEVKTIAALAKHRNAPKEGSAEAEVATQTFKTWGKKTITKAGMADVLPFFLLNLDATYEDGRWASWPPMPKPIRWAMTNIVGAYYGNYWKFSSCNAEGQPKELFVYEFPAAKTE